MPALVTKTVRLKKTQNEKLLAEYGSRASFLFRSLFDIFTNDRNMPGLEIIKLRTNMKLPQEEFEKLEK